MYSPKLRPAVATCEITKPGSRGRSTSCSTLRHWLLAWGFLRLVVSTLWTCVIIIRTVTVPRFGNDMLWLTIKVTLTQLVEFGMLVTFIEAGFKKSTKLYRVYYYYCILTLVIYIVAVSLCFGLDNHFFGEIYLTYNFMAVLGIANNDGLAFGVAAFLDVCLEIFLISLVKRLINQYSCNEDVTTAENA